MKKIRVWIYVAIAVLLCFYVRHRLLHMRSNQQLLEAIDARNPAGVRAALEAGADVHTSGSDELTAVHIVMGSQSDPWDASSHPLVKGEALQAHPASQRSAWPQVARDMVEFDKAPERSPEDIQSEFMMAAMVGSTEAMRRLIDHVAKLNDPGKFDFNSILNSALANSIYKGHAEVAELLLDKGAKPDREPGMLLQALTQCGPALFQRLLSSGLDVNLTDSSGKTALSMLAGDKTLGPRKTDYLQTMLSAGADINQRVKVTHEQGYRNNVTYDTPLNSASLAGDLPFVQALLSRGAKIDPDIPYLLSAAESGNKALFHFFLDKGANPFAKDWEGNTAREYFSKQRPRKPELIALCEAAERQFK